jgi:hypothetical protein
VSRTGGPADQRGAWTGPHDVIASQRAILPSHLFGFVEADKSDIGCIIKKNAGRDADRPATLETRLS